jgi:FkbM family methyltransferase
MGRLLANTMNRVFSLFGARLVPEWEIKALKAHNPRMDFLLRLARRGFKPTHIIDVGANLGSWTRDAHQVFPDCAFTLIEPQIELKPLLDPLCARLKNSRWIMAGAGETNGELAFTIGKQLDGSSFSVTEEQAKTEGRERRVVPVVTLDSVCEKLVPPAPEIVKIDAEGFELSVMRGARRLIGMTELFFLEVPFLGSEPDDSFLGMVSFMHENGYEPYDITEYIRSAGSENLGAVEMAFAKRDGVLRSAFSEWTSAH